MGASVCGCLGVDGGMWAAAGTRVPRPRTIFILVTAPPVGGRADARPLDRGTPTAGSVHPAARRRTRARRPPQRQPTAPLAPGGRPGGARRDAVAPTATQSPPVCRRGRGDACAWRRRTVTEKPARRGAVQPPTGRPARGRAARASGAAAGRGRPPPPPGVRACAGRGARPAPPPTPAPSPRGGGPGGRAAAPGDTRRARGASAPPRRRATGRRRGRPAAPRVRVRPRRPHAARARRPRAAGGRSGGVRARRRRARGAGVTGRRRFSRHGTRARPPPPDEVPLGGGDGRGRPRRKGATTSGGCGHVGRVRPRRAGAATSDGGRRGARPAAGRPRRQGRGGTRGAPHATAPSRCRVGGGCLQPVTPARPVGRRRPSGGPSGAHGCPWRRSRPPAGGGVVAHPRGPRQGGRARPRGPWQGVHGWAEPALRVRDEAGARRRRGAAPRGAVAQPVQLAAASGVQVLMPCHHRTGMKSRKCTGQHTALTHVRVNILTGQYRGRCWRIKPP